MSRRKATLELFEEIRREYEFGIGTSQGVARKFGVHRRLVREALQGAVPQERPAPHRPQPRLGPVAPAAARQAPRQQRHTAHRIYERIRAESPDRPVAEPTVRRYVGQRKAALGRWPASFDRFWEGRLARQGRPYGHARRRAASEAALALGCAAGAAVRHRMTTVDQERVPPAAREVGGLAQFERPLPALTPYDQLLPAGGAR